MVNIAISGKMGSGKTTLTNRLNDIYGDTNTETFKFAEAIYEEAYARGMSRDPKLKNRQLLIDIGEEKKKEDPDYWTKQTMKQLDDVFKKRKFDVLKDDAKFPKFEKGYDYGTRQMGLSFKKEKLYLIDDLRFRNEFNALKKRGDWVLIRLNIPQLVQKERLMASYPDTYETVHFPKLTHITETDLDEETDFDYTFGTHKVSPDEIIDVLVKDKVISGVFKKTKKEEKEAEKEVKKTKREEEKIPGAESEKEKKA